MLGLFRGMIFAGLGGFDLSKVGLAISPRGGHRLCRSDVIAPLGRRQGVVRQARSLCGADLGFGRIFAHLASIAAFALACTLSGGAHAATYPATQATLTAVWKAAAPGDEIRVSGPLTGPFAGIAKAAPGVTIVAEPGASIEPGGGGWFVASGIQGARFVGFPIHSLVQFNAQSGPCSRVVIEGADVSTPGAAIQFRGCVNVEPADWVGVFNSRFRGGAGGVGANGVRGLIVSGNSFTDNPSDAIQLGVYGDVVLERNTFTNFRGEPLHRDAMQLIAADQTKPITNVVIRGNRIERGDGIPAQFIFLSDSAAGYDGVWVEGNVDLGSSFHGVTINMPLRATIENNFLQPDSRLWNGQLLVPWIKPMNVPAGAVVVVRNNTLPPAAAPGDRSALTAWLKTPPPALAGPTWPDLSVDLAVARKAASDAQAVAASYKAALDAADAMVAAVREAVKP